VARNFLVGVACLALLALNVPSYAGGIRLHPEDKKHLLQDRFQIINKVENLPASVQSEFAHLVHERTFQMANPGQEFQVTDFIQKQGLPFRRLIFAGVSSQYCLVHYEMGGIGHGYYMVLFRLSKDKVSFAWFRFSKDRASFVWGGCPQPFRPLANWAELKTFIKKDKFDDRTGIYW